VDSGGSALRGHAHERLRTATRDLHRELDSRLLLSSLTKRDGYGRYLLTNWPCASIEPALTKAGIHRLLPDWAQRERRFALEDDLTMLGVLPPPARSCTIDEDTGTILGWSYVLEGSRLGARQILRAVEANGDPDIRRATRFLRHGEGKDFWGSFKAALAQIDQDGVAIAKACTAAIIAFEWFADAAAS
jgi:heme oxygenase